MKKIFTLSLVAFMMVATMCVSSCSTAKSVNKAFEKNGYVLTALTPAQQIEVCPVVAKFPSFPVEAMGYLTLGNSCTFIYAIDQATWDSYAAQLQSAGFSNMGIGYVKADKSAGVTYNVSAKATTIYKQDFMLVTFTSAAF
ncbi:MAG: hypothetical protein E7089_03230 [Bacteroidales bacterium]|nr:hypothetical protein [Bacteroidales bacterium]